MDTKIVIRKVIKICLCLVIYYKIKKPIFGDYCRFKWYSAHILHCSIDRDLFIRHTYEYRILYIIFFKKTRSTRYRFRKTKGTCFYKKRDTVCFFFLFEHVITNKVGCTYVEKQRLLSLENGLVSMTKVRVYLWCCVYDKLIKRHLK